MKMEIKALLDFVGDPQYREDAELGWQQRFRKTVMLLPWALGVALLLAAAQDPQRFQPLDQVQEVGAQPTQRLPLAVAGAAGIPVARKLGRAGVSAAVIHGDRSQRRREAVTGQIGAAQVGFPEDGPFAGFHRETAGSVPGRRAVFPP